MKNLDFEKNVLGGARPRFKVQNHGLVIVGDDFVDQVKLEHLQNIVIGHPSLPILKNLNLESVNIENLTVNVNNPAEAGKIAAALNKINEINELDVNAPNFAENLVSDNCAKFTQVVRSGLDA